MTRMNPYAYIAILLTLFLLGISLGKASARADDAIVRFKAVAPAPVALDKMICSLKQVENWDGHSIGRAGERGPLQLKKETWHQFSNKPHYWAERRNPYAAAEADRVETLYVLWIMQDLREVRKPLTPFFVALIHNAGFSTVMTLLTFLAIPISIQ